MISTVEISVGSRWDFNRELSKWFLQFGGYGNSRTLTIGNLELWFSSQTHFTIRLNGQVVRIDGFTHKFSIDTDQKVLLIDDCMAFQWTAQ